MPAISKVPMMMADGGGILASLMKPTTAVAAPVAATAAPVATPQAQSTSSLADLLNPNNLGMGQQLSPDAWAAIQKATGTDIGPAQDGKYYTFTGQTDDNSTGWTPTQAYYDALNGYNGSYLGNFADGNRWNITGPSGQSSSITSSNAGLGLMEPLTLGAIGLMTGGGLLANGLSPAAAGAASGALTGFGTSGTIGGALQGGAIGGAMGGIGGAISDALSPTAVAADQITGLPAYAIDPVNSYANQAAIGLMGLPNYAVDPVNSYVSQAAVGASGLPNYALDPVNSYANQTAIGSTGLPNYALDPVSANSYQAAVNPEFNLPNYAVDPANSYANQQAIDAATGLPNYALDPAPVATTPAAPAPTADYSNEGNNYPTQESTAGSPVNSTPTSNGLWDWMKNNPLEAKLLLSGGMGLLNGLGGGGSGGGSSTPIVGKTWNAAPAGAAAFKAPTQYQAGSLPTSGVNGAGAWQWMKRG